jgi:hypothetical protein
MSGGCVITDPLVPIVRRTDQRLRQYRLWMPPPEQMA